MSQDNVKRLQALVDASSMSKVAYSLGVNIGYLSRYLNRGIEPTIKTKNGKRIRKALGIVSKKLKSTRKSQALNEAYARGKGYESCSQVWTLARNGHDVLLINPVGEGSGGE